MVFHGSNIQNLEVIKPALYFRHNEPLIFASRNLHIATLYIDTVGGEFACTIVMDNHFHMPVIVERMRDGIRKRYSEKQGSVYGLRNDAFDYLNAIEHFANAEMVARTPQVPMIEMKFENSLKYILELGDQRKIRIIPYKDRYDYLPKTDIDLKQLFVKYLAAEEQDPELMAMIRAYHPTIYNTIIPKKLQEKQT